ncbi:SCP-2 sterol transfer family protein [Psychrobacter sp. YP14]|jgi:putative sterol carrier protein|uniref:SCP-2 sterol transfer family protein n=3 Tax=Psychrobacter TaxID=497 RepID=A0A844M0H1_9GAMM|nr:MULTISPECIES: SCP2 sterol-binding domain-containing protein [Psychrobacter]AWT49476.1 SCP-2 sterol transfer family protein [Psychrobacter sp. YP14]MUG32274.1 SCP-2 sterol transfer family protein [Psychrobacter sanguinis]
MAVFLTDEWFNEVDRLTKEAGELNLPPALANMKLNLKVTNTANGDVDASLVDGVLKKGASDANTTINIDEETLKAIALKGDMNEAMNAFMSGKIRIDGDMGQVMALQTTKPSAEQKELFKKIYSMTEQG